jgi:hypothetical protein
MPKGVTVGPYRPRIYHRIGRGNLILFGHGFELRIPDNMPVWQAAQWVQAAADAIALSGSLWDDPASRAFLDLDPEESDSDGAVIP